MAIWNPFNLFKRKEKEAVPQETGSPEAVPQQAEFQEAVLQEAESRETESLESESSGTLPATAAPVAPIPHAPPAAGVIPRETLASDAIPGAASLSESSAQQPAEIDAAAIDSQPDQEQKTRSILEPDPTRGQTQPPIDVSSQTLTPPPAAKTHVPFVEQAAPSKPIDFAERISQRPKTSSASPTAPAAPTASGGLTAWFRSAISKTAKVLNTDIRDLVGREGRLVDDEFLKELFSHLIKTDMGVGPAQEIRDAIHKNYRGRKVHLNELIGAAKNTISQIMKQEEVRLTLADSGTSVIMVVGVNGSGKTTSIAKLASMFRQDGKSVLLGAGDTFRAAAVEQLRQWASRIGAEIVTGEDRADPASVAFRAVKHAQDHKFDICIVDTAGRLQTQSHLMQELSKIRRVIDKVIPGAPHETLLVLDSTAGQNAISQARGFSDAAGCSGIVLAKMDGTAKGGVAIPIRKEFNLPVKFIGFGETADAIAPFDVQRYVDALFNID